MSWALIVMVCVRLECADIKILSVHKTEAECVEAMQKVEIESGAYGCISKETEDIKT